MRTLALVIAAIACGPRSASGPSGTTRAEQGIEVTLYRDHAVVAHRMQVVIPPAAPATVRMRIAAGVAPDDIYLIEKSELVVREVRVAGATPLSVGAGEGCDEVSCVLDNYERECCKRFERKPSEWEDEPVPEAIKPSAPATPTDVEVIIGGPRAGTFSLLIGYDTPRIAWDVAYAMTTPPTRDRVELRGAISIRNASGLVFPDAGVSVVDAQHGPPTQRIAARLSLAGADPNITPRAQARPVGRLSIIEGDTRVELIDDVAARPMRSVLVFDPIGPGLDYQHGQPVQDRNLGVSPPPGTRVTESFEIDRIAATRHLPGGPVRLLERRPDGTVALLGDAKLFGTGTLAASVDTIPIGTASGVTGKRERRELTIDNDRKRIVEEIALTIDNTRDRPVEVVLREHLYRGENWTIAYRSVFDIAKEGKQQIAMRVTVPARGKQTVLYVVVYSWDK